MLSAIPPSPDTPQFRKKSVQHDRAQWSALKQYLTLAFLAKSRDEWTSLFKDTDSCVAPVLSLGESNTLWSSSVPPVAPQLSRTPAEEVGLEGDMILQPGFHSITILRELGYLEDQRERMLNEGAVQQYKDVRSKSKL